MSDTKSHKMRQQQWNGNSIPLSIPQLREPETRVKLTKELKENINDSTPNRNNSSSLFNQSCNASCPLQQMAPKSSSNLLVPGSSNNLRELSSPMTVTTSSLPSSLPLGKKQTPPNRGKWSGMSILRPGESMESFFGIDQASTEEYRKLCRSIANGVEDSAKTWRRVLELASERAAADPAWLSNGTNLIRLHRRATSRLSDATSNEANLVSAIWLSYAQALARYGCEKDARVMFKYIQNQRLCEFDANLYLALFELELKTGHEQEARASLKQGIENKAQPLSVLTEALNKFDIKLARSESQSEKQITQECSKKRKIDSETISCNPAAVTFKENELALRDTAGLCLLSTSSKKASLSFQLKPAPKSRDLFPSDDSTPPKSNLKQSSQSMLDTSESVTSSGSKHSLQKPGNETPQQGSAIKTQGLRYAGIFSSTRPLRPPLLSKTPLPLKTPLISRGSLGKPERVDPSTAFLTDVDTDDEEDSERCQDDVTKQKKEKTTERSGQTKSSSKITKMDLSYMWAWDPNKPRKAGQKSEETNSHAPQSAPDVENVSADSSNLEPQALNAIKKVENNKATDNKASKPKDEEHTKTGQTNNDFLPLVKESNMIRVNNVPYAKLGVIGRGGSCKVYRALSKNCSVLAIKKVKLDGMDKKAIDGYSNEIALLKRLRGNPAIIQMFDSEVDLERKSILLAMELGEVDLNHVLQQQEMAMAAKRDRRQLNLNFIRLTWQQMLTAVHSIHEERIIHGDLKPANFLFDRGALKLIDFGIAKAIQSDDTTNIYRESQIGTLNYMSPEAILDTGSSSDGLQMKLGRASDIWSLGCILYQMVYGKTPFADLHMIQKLQAIVNPNYRILFPGEMDENAVDAIKQCLQRNPQQRPPIIGENGLLNHHKFLNG